MTATSVLGAANFLDVSGESVKEVEFG